MRCEQLRTNAQQTHNKNTESEPFLFPSPFIVKSIDALETTSSTLTRVCKPRAKRYAKMPTPKIFDLEYYQRIPVIVAAVVALLFAIDVKGLVVVIVGTLASIATTGACVGVIVIVVFETQGPNPSQPCCAHDVVRIAAEVFVVAEIVVVSRQPPNQPYFTQEVVGPSVVVTVVVGVVEVEAEVLSVVVDSSRQPHHPGVLHVVVLVRLDVLELLLLLDVVASDPLLSKYFQLKQSTHSSSGKHGGTSS